MKPIERIKQSMAYASGHKNTPMDAQLVAKQLCFEYNRTSPDKQDKRKDILKKLLGTYSESAVIEPDSRCDYGFNIHFHGFALINYNCVILDTSPVNIGNVTFIAP